MCLVENNVGLVYYCMTEVNIRHSDEDAFSFGMQGLLKAAAHFDPERGFKFSTYAYRAIRWRLLRYLKHHRRIGRPSDAMNQAGLCQLRESTHRGGREHSAEAAMVVRDLLGSLAKVDARTARVVYQRYFERRLLKEIGAELGVSKERVRQIVEEGLRWMRQNAA